MNPVSLLQLDTVRISSETRVLFVGDAELFRAIRFGWNDCIGQAQFFTWDGTKPVQVSKEVSAEVWPVPVGREISPVALPRLFDDFDASFSGRIRFLLLKILWPALGEQQRFNKLLRASTENLAILIEKNDLFGRRMVRHLVLEKTVDSRSRFKKLSRFVDEFAPGARKES